MFRSSLRVQRYLRQRPLRRPVHPRDGARRDLADRDVIAPFATAESELDPSLDGVLRRVVNLEGTCFQ
jgi:hypothetical protein